MTRPADPAAMERAAERARIVEWLRIDAAEYEGGGPFGKVAFAALMQAANHIERGDHDR